MYILRVFEEATQSRPVAKSRLVAKSRPVASFGIGSNKIEEEYRKNPTVIMTVKTIVQQSTGRRNQRVAAKSLYITLYIVAGIELYCLSQDQYLPFSLWEKSVIIGTSFLLIFAYVWLTGKRNMQIKISETGVEFSHDEEISRFTWGEVRKWRQPAVVVRPYWLFELKNTQKIKISTRHFSKKQLRQISKSFAKTTGRVYSKASKTASLPRV
jgi:hypothetical protein